MRIFDRLFGRKEEKKIKDFIRHLKYESHDDRTKEAKIAFEKIGEPAIEYLIPALKDKNPHVREGAVEVLGEIGGERAVEALIQALKMIFSLFDLMQYGRLGRSGIREPLNFLVRHC